MSSLGNLTRLINTLLYVMTIHTAEIRRHGASSVQLAQITNNDWCCLFMKPEGPLDMRPQHLPTSAEVMCGVDVGEVLASISRLPINLLD